MRIIIMGGAGDMGQVACATTAADPAITSVLVADRDRRRATEVARRLGPKGAAMALDITDGHATAAALADVDLVLNTVGPFYLYGRPVLEAAVTAGKHYADIADDWEPTIEMLELDDRARAAGITAIVGMGASPGVSNLLAAVAHAQLDVVESLHTVWRGGSGVPKAPANPADLAPAAAIDHWIHNLSEPIRVWRDGEYRTTDALEKLEIVYPGVGPADVWTCGHPEPITLPRTFPDVRHCLNVMFARPGLIDAARKVRNRVRSGELTVPEGSLEFLMMPGRRGPEAGPVPDLPGVFAYAEGVKDGKPARTVVSTDLLPEGGMGEATCVPLAVAAGMIARGEVSRKGVMAPEAAIAPGVFFPRLAPFAADRVGREPLNIVVETF
ncbi:saccharopine dehydrogenase NADP-binding domain-containing protein [Streptomyces sp. NPDC005811]|uniref:saccharopine dehydrogenase family protein n=1 Tax=Streptomyces sp. NPDC005811 TaxID=3154565 RepID=UPI0033E2855A